MKPAPLMIPERFVRLRKNVAKLSAIVPNLGVYLSCLLVHRNSENEVGHTSGDKNRVVQTFPRAP